MTASKYLSERFPKQHTFPKSQVIEIIEEFNALKKRKKKKVHGCNSSKQNW